MPANVESVRRKTEALLREGFLNPEIDQAVHVGEPVAVMNPNGTQHSWFVPLQVGAKLAGFAQLLTSLVPMRISSFQHHPHEYESCPDVADWTDPRRIASRAASIAKPGEQLSDPVLTYDRSPDRLAWKVEARHPGGSTRRLFVAGTAVYEDVGAQGLM